MTHPLIDFLRTPLAAPETPRLRRLRLSWTGLCVALGIAVLCNSALVSLLGPGAALPALLLLVVMPLMGFIYLRAKSRADAAYFGELASPEEEP